MIIYNVYHFTHIQRSFFFLASKYDDGVIIVVVGGRAAAGGDPGRLRVAGDRAVMGPAAVLLVPGAKELLREENRQVQQHGFSDQRTPGVPLVRGREP